MKRTSAGLVVALFLAGCSGEDPITGPEAMRCELPASPFPAAAVADITAAEIAEASRDAVERLIPGLPEGEERDRLSASLDHFASNLATASASTRMLCLAAVTADRALRTGGTVNADDPDRAAIRLVVDVVVSHLAYGTVSLSDHGQALW